MRITLVTETFYPVIDGTTTTLKAVADRLVDAGHTVSIIAPAPGLSSYRGAEVVRVLPLEALGPQIRSALTRLAPDLVQVLSPGTIGRKALKQTQRSAIASVVVEQSPVLDLSADYWRSKVAERTDLVLVTSPWMVERAAELGVRATLWAPGVDTAAFTPTLRDQWLHDSWSRARSESGPHVVVGYVGSLHKRHGVRRLADLADLPATRMVIIGEGPQRRWLEPRVPGAKFTGALTTGDLTVALPTLDVLVHPGEHETCCHVLREASASGVPIVAPRSGGAASVVRHLESGLLYDARDPRGLREAVRSVVADPRRGLLGQAGRKHAAERTWGDAVTDLLGHLDALRHSGSVATTRT